MKHPREDLLQYRVQLRYYLRVRGVAIAAEDRVCCPQPGHHDEEFSASLIESAEGDCVQCDSCATSWDIFDIEGFLGGAENTKGTFPRRLAAVKDALATVLPEGKPGDGKSITEMSDEEFADISRRRKEADKQTAANRQRIREQAEGMIDTERRKANEARIRDLPFRVLGTAPDGYTYYLDRNERLQSFRLASLTKTQLQILAPIDWWIRQFPGSRGRLEVDMAIDFLIEISNGVSFEPASLRGRGCWREE